MVCEWGMSEKLGPLQYGQKEEPIFIGKEIARHKDYSEKTSELIDEEVKQIVAGAYKRATKILKEHKDILDKLAKRVLEKEVLDRKEIEKIVGVNKIKDDGTSEKRRKSSNESSGKKSDLDNISVASSKTKSDAGG